MLRKAGGPPVIFPCWNGFRRFCRRTRAGREESDEFQQFSTPLGLGFLMVHAAQLPPGALVLEPSAGTGLLAIHAEIAGAALALNELAETRHAMLVRRCFRKVAGDALQRRADRRLSRSRDHARDRGDEPALLGVAQYRPHDARRDRPAYPLGARAACRRAAASWCSRTARTIRRRRDIAGTLPRSRRTRPRLRLHRDRGRPHLCAPRHERRYAPHRHRPHSEASGAARQRPATREPSPNCSAFIESGLPPRAASGCRAARCGRAAPAAAHAPVRARSNAPLFRFRRRKPASAGTPRNWSTKPREASGADGALQRPHLRALSGAKHRRSPEPGRIRPSSCNRRPWRPSARPFLPTGPCCRGG